MANQALAKADLAVVRRSTNRSGNGAPVHFAAARCDRSAPPNDHDLLHALRTERLAAMPGGAKVMLSAGCAGRWYFDWIDAAYPGVEHHIGIEAYLPEPSDLPSHISWLPSSVRSMTGVDDSSVDLVYSGQNIEHLWAADVVGFLLESRRVLRDGALLVLDSPNAWICDALNYLMPEHVAELTPAEISDLLALAGFNDISVHGVWLCFDRDRQLLLPLAPNRVLDGWTTERRQRLAPQRPDDSFIWWAEARATDPPRIDQLVEAVDRIIATRYQQRLHNPVAPLGRIVGRANRRWCSIERGEAGCILRGPRAPLPPGRHEVRFSIRRGTEVQEAPIARVDVFSETTGAVLAERTLLARDVSAETFTSVVLPVALSNAAFGVEFRAHATGNAAITVSLDVDVRLAPSVPFYADEFGTA